MLDIAKIKLLREKKMLSLSEASAAAGWGAGARTRWHEIESGRNVNPKLVTLQQMARALGCKTASLIID